MDERIVSYLQALRDDVTAVAEEKMGRSLSEEEADGLRRVNSGMRLESLYMAFSHVNTSASRVAADLATIAEAPKGQ